MNRRIRTDMDDRMNLEFMADRAFYRGLGYSDDEIEKPHIGIINTWQEINPGHIHQKEIAAAAREGILEAGGRPFLFYGMNLCDSLGMGQYVLPSRDLLVNEIEVYCEAHKLDALLLIGTCDKIVPAMLMAAARLDVPTVIVTGGYMATGSLDGQDVDFIDIGAHISMLKEVKINEEKFDNLLDVACPGCGACGMMGTANSMNLLCETIGMSLPGNACTPARSGRLLQLARRAGRKVVELWENGITARQIITEASITNAIKTCSAIGGSSNTIIHLPAIATEAELDMDCSKVFASASSEIPLLIGIRPNGKHSMTDLDKAGGLYAVLDQIKDHLDTTTKSISGKTLGELMEGARILDPNVIRTVDNPLSSDGGLVLVRGNLVPEGAFIKRSAVPECMYKFTGRAKVFNDAEKAVAALRKGEITEGDAVFILYQGLKGGPNTAYPFVTALKGSHLKDSVCMITDGRTSGAASGAVFQYASPEAALKGPLCAVKDGDIIEYDIDKGYLNINVDEDELNKRIENTEITLPKRKGYMGIYQKCVGSILKGGVLSGD